MSILKDKNVIVTGASGGIGNSIVKVLNDSGANILATGTKIEKLEQLKSKFNNTGRKIHNKSSQSNSRTLLSRVGPKFSLYHLMDGTSNSASLILSMSWKSVSIYIDGI